MTTLKDMMKKGMTHLMLDCDKATLLITKKEFERLDCITRMKLRMHLFSCKLCRQFERQSNFITKQVQEMGAVNDENLSVHLSKDQKEKLEAVIEENQL